MLPIEVSPACGPTGNRSTYEIHLRNSPLGASRSCSAAPTSGPFSAFYYSISATDKEDEKTNIPRTIPPIFPPSLYNPLKSTRDVMMTTPVTLRNSCITFNLHASTLAQPNPNHQHIPKRENAYLSLVATIAGPCSALAGLLFVGPCRCDRRGGPISCV